MQKIETKKSIEIIDKWHNILLDTRLMEFEPFHLYWGINRNSGPLFAKGTDVLQQDLVQSWSRKILLYIVPIVLRFDRHLDSSATPLHLFNTKFGPVVDEYPSATGQQCFSTGMLELKETLIVRFMGPTWGPSGADRTQVGPMLAPWTLLSGPVYLHTKCHITSQCLLTIFFADNQMWP